MVDAREHHAMPHDVRGVGGGAPLGDVLGRVLVQAALGAENRVGGGHVSEARERGAGGESRVAPHRHGWEWERRGGEVWVRVRHGGGHHNKKPAPAPHKVA